MRLLDDELMDEIASLPLSEAGKWLILEPHSQFEGYWEVNSLGLHYKFDLRDVIGSQRVVSPANLEEFLKEADDHGYHVAFGEPPETILEAYSMLNVTPEVQINSDLPGTVNGLLPFQVRGFNKIKGLEGAAAVWSTGTGKSVLQSALVRYHLARDNFDLCLLVCKGHNKVNTQRSLLALAGQETLLLDGAIGTRVNRYIELMQRLDEGTPTTVVTNYEKFRDDFVEFYIPEKKKTEACRIREEFVHLFTGKRLLIIWDEMPTKLKNRTSKLYTAVCTCLYDCRAPKVDWERKRAPELRQIMLSATPIENSPADWFNCERLLNGGRTYGTVADFENRYVATWNHFDRNKPERWHRLDEMNLRGSHVMHIVDKVNDPEIAKQFPKHMPVERILDWNDKHWGIYQEAQALAEKAIDEAEEEGEPFNPLGLLAVLKMLCALPSSLASSALVRQEYEDAFDDWVEKGDPKLSEPRRRGSEAALQLINALGGVPKDDGHTKLTEFRGIIDSHPEDKIVYFSSLNHTVIPTICNYLDDWGISHVRYDGSTRQKQAAEDAFCNDPDIRVFVSSDKGSDSINLQVAPVVVNYDLPMKYSTKNQRENRVHRVTSTFATTWAYDLLMANSIDERWKKLIEKKFGYHAGVFQGAAMHGSIAAGMTKGDLLYALRGR